MNIWTPKETIKGYGYEWYAPNIGIVRSEQYNNKKGATIVQCVRKN